MLNFDWTFSWVHQAMHIMYMTGAVDLDHNDSNDDKCHMSAATSSIVVLILIL